MNKQEWVKAIKTFSKQQRQTNTVPDREKLSYEDEWSCRIIGGEFINWYQERLRRIVMERAALKMVRFDPKPYILFTTTMPGLVAVQEIMPDMPETLICLLHSEYRNWAKENSVNEFTFHVHHWNCFNTLDLNFLPEAKKLHPSISENEFRLHSSGDLWAEQCGRGTCHLWQWDGQEMCLLEEAFTQIIY